jgi:hypothetical protein
VAVKKMKKIIISEELNDDEILGNDEARISLYFSKNDEK